jgi:hypothetical protein
MNVHHKCREKVANLCGINQKLLAEALNQVTQVGRARGRDLDIGQWEQRYQGSQDAWGALRWVRLLEDS